MLEEASVRPYFIRAVYQWCIDEGYSPYILARWADNNPSKVPPRLINDGKIVFNISPEAVRHLVVNADGIFFTARFVGQTVEVHIPLPDVLSIYAREKQSGISFPPLPTQQPAAVQQKTHKDAKQGKKRGGDKAQKVEVKII